jgi:soluble lytic murein transglycosylase-like protein
MRQTLIVLTCLLLTAWAEPAGNFDWPEPVDNSPAVSVVEKTPVGTASQTVGAASENDWPTGPAETTQQLTNFDEPNDATAPVANSEPQKFESGDALAALDAIADEFGLAPQQAVPMPPRRAVPHAQVCEALADAAINNDLPTPFFIRLIWQESGFKQNIVSHAGAQGVAQFMPETAASRGLDDPFNPLQAVRASAHLLHDLFQQFGNLGLAAAAYNAGPRRVQNWLEKGGKLPQETRDYVERITGMKAEQWKGKITAAGGRLRVPARAPCQREAGLYASNGPEQIPLPPSQPKAAPEPAPVKSASRTVKTASAKARSHETKTPVAIAKHGGKDAGKITGKNHGKKVKLADAERQ